MKDALNNITIILEKECEIYKDLLELSRKKTELITEGYVKELDKLVKVEQNLVVHVGRLEEARMQQAALLAHKQNLPLNKLNLAALTSLGDEEIQERLQKVGEKLETYLQELKQVNEVNGKMLKHNLEYIDFSLNVITGQGDSGAVYEKGGKNSDKASKRNLFDRQA